MSTDNQPIEEDLPEQLRIRREKRASLLERNVEPYPVSVPRTKSLKEIREKYVGLEIDVATGEAAKAINQRSDVCAVPAAGVVAEAMVALVLAEVVLEKFGGDSVKETLRNMNSYLDSIPDTLRSNIAR